MLQSDLQLDGMDKALNTNSLKRDSLVKRASNRGLFAIIENKTLGRLSNRITDWSGDLNLDHIIPVGITYGIPELQEMLKGIANLRLLHVGCHKVKTFGAEKEFFKIVRKHMKSLIAEGVSVKEAYLKSILKVHQEGLFNRIVTDRKKKVLLNKFIKKVTYLIRCPEKKEFFFSGLNKNIKV